MMGFRILVVISAICIICFSVKMLRRGITSKMIETPVFLLKYVSLKCIEIIDIWLKPHHWACDSEAWRLWSLYAAGLAVANAYLLYWARDFWWMYSGTHFLFYLFNFMLLYPDEKFALSSSQAVERINDFSFGALNYFGVKPQPVNPTILAHKTSPLFYFITVYTSSLQLALVDYSTNDDSPFINFNTFVGFPHLLFWCGIYLIVCGILECAKDEISNLIKMACMHTYSILNIPAISEILEILGLVPKIIRGLWFVLGHAAAHVFAELLQMQPDAMEKMNIDTAEVKTSLASCADWQLWSLYAGTIIVVNSSLIYFRAYLILFLTNFTLLYPDFDFEGLRYVPERNFVESVRKRKLFFSFITISTLVMQLALFDKINSDVYFNRETKSGFVYSFALFVGYFAAIWLAKASISAYTNALEQAVMTEDVKTLEFFLRFLWANPDTKMKSQEDATLIDYAAMFGLDSTVEVLLRYGASVFSCNVHYGGRPPLLLACRYGFLSVAKQIIACGADIHTKDLLRGESSILLASYNGHFDVVELLLSHGASVEDRSADQEWTPLMSASANGHESIVELLLRHKADINAKTENIEGNGTNALIVASLSEESSFNTVQLLTSQGANMNVGTNTAKMFALFNGKSEVARFLDDWPLIMFIVIMEELQVYDQLDFANVADIFEFTTEVERDVTNYDNQFDYGENHGNFNGIYGPEP